MDSHLLAFLLLVAVPAWDWLEVRLLRRSTSPQARRNFYLRVIGVLWALTGLACLLVPLSTLMAAPVFAQGLPRQPFPHFAPSPVIVVALLFALLAPVLLCMAHRPTRARFMAAFDAIDFLLPRKASEYWLFAAVAVTAGICEEILYRGFLFHYLAEGQWQLSLGPVLFLTSVAFGLAHIGQGWKQLLATPLIGLGLGFLFLGTGSLLLPILLHVSIDLRALAFAMMRSGSVHPPTLSSNGVP